LTVSLQSLAAFHTNVFPQMLTVLKLACKIAANLLLLEQKGLQVTDSARGLLLFDA